jgi:hypothetical protein
MSQEPPEKQSPKQSPFLRAILSGKTRAVVSRVRVFPLINPYRKTDAAKWINSNKLPKDMEHPEKDWFNNYE